MNSLQTVPQPAVVSTTRLRPSRWVVGDCRRSLIKSLVAFACSFVLAGPTPAQNSTGWIVTLHDGSAFVVESLTTEITWRDLYAAGSPDSRPILVSEISRLSLTSESTLKQIKGVQELIAKLGHPDYAVREAAEKELGATKMSQATRKIMDEENNNPNLEISVRLKRAASSLRTATARPINGNQYDWLTLKNGKVLRGDAGQFEIKCAFRGAGLTLQRDQISHLQTRAESPSVAAATTADNRVVAELVSTPPETMEAGKWSRLDFDRDQVGDDMLDRTDVAEAFIDYGIRFAAEIPGFIGIVLYPLKSAELPEGGKSIAVYAVGPSSISKFKGCSRISFCQPCQPLAASGVRELGMFGDVIDQPRHFVLQAFNEDGQMLVNVEANSRRRVFFGARCSEPIAFVRFLPNPHLAHLPKLADFFDQNYALDELTFTKPESVLPVGSNSQVSIRLKTGGTFLASEFAFIDAVRCTLKHEDIPSPITLGVDELDWVLFPNAQLQQPAPNSNRWFALLDDRSVLEVKPGENFVAQRLNSWNVPRDKILAVWSERDFLRYPLEGDFASAKNVLVFPTCRVATDALDLSPSQLKWDEARSTKLMQPIDSSSNRSSKGEEPAEDDPSPQFWALDWVDSKEVQVPSIWLRPPVAKIPGCGSIDLRNGEKLVFGSGSQFSLQSVDSTGPKLSGPNNQTLEPKWAEIWRFDF